MSCRLRALTLLLVLLWQSIAALGPVTVAQRAADIAHWAVHSQDSDHHHHADKALHLDDDAVQHLHADSGISPVGLLTSVWSALPRVRSMPPPRNSPSPLALTHA